MRRQQKKRAALVSCMAVLACLGLLTLFVRAIHARQQPELAAEPEVFVKPDPGCLNIKDSVHVYRSLIPPKIAADVFGKRIAKRYVVIQVTVSNRSRDYQFLIHDASLDVSQMFSTSEIENLTAERNALLREEAENLQKGIGRLQRTPETEAQKTAAKALEKQKVQIERQMAQPFRFRSLSSEEISIVRGVGEAGQLYSPRNIILRLLRGAGAIAGGITGITTFGSSYAPTVAAFNGPVLTAYENAFPDETINQLNRLHDSAYRADTLVAKDQSKVFVVFLPQAIFMNTKRMGKFYSDPTKLQKAIDFRRVEVIVRGCFINEVQKKQFSVTTAQILPGEMQKFRGDQTPIVVKGYVLGQALSGAIPKLQDSPKVLTIKRVDEGSSDTRLNFEIDSTVPVPPGTVLNIRVDKNNVSHSSSVVVGYSAGPPPSLASLSPSNSAQNSEVNLTLTGSHFIPGLTEVLVTPPEITVRDVSVKDASTIKATFHVKASAEPGSYQVRVVTMGTTSKPVTFTVTKAAPPPGSNTGPSTTLPPRQHNSFESLRPPQRSR